MRRVLDGLYDGFGVLAALCLATIALLTLAQIASRILGFLIPSADDFAGMAMAAASFFGLAHTLRRGSHVRVILLLSKLGPSRRRVLEIVCLAAALATLGFVTWHTGWMIYFAHRYNEFTIGLIPVPKWIPMMTMIIGLAVLTIAYLDDLVQILTGRRASYGEGEGGEAVDLEAELAASAVPPRTDMPSARGSR